MPRPSSKRRPPAGKSERGGFTMIELLMVIIIIAILVGLLLPAIQSAMRTARRAAVSSEINQLATALANFKSKYGDYPPSRFLAVEYGDYSTFLVNTMPLTTTTPSDPYSPGEGDISMAQLAQRSVAAIRKFWPRVNTATGSATNTLVYDFNGNGNPDGAYILHGHECLVFFLGGVPSQDSSGNFGLNGFDKNPQNPFTNNISTSALYGPNRQPPTFEFVPGRLYADATSNTGIPGYYDSLGNAPPGGGTTLNFYAYFSAYGNGGYDPNDVNFGYEIDNLSNGPPIGLGFLTSFPVQTNKVVSYCESYAPNPYTSTLTSAIPVIFQKPQSFQIISSGIDGLYGVGGQYLAATTSATNQLPFDGTTTFYGVTTGSSVSLDTDPSIRKREQDNLSNFTTGSLE
jgi:prepilin-type N-terminal cleavage/methylation domain-containing protein